MKWLGACLALCVLSYLNARGIQVAGWLSVALLVAVLIPVAWLCIVSLFKLHYNPVLPFTPPGQPFGSVFGKGLALAMWNYAGYEQLSSMTGEMKDSQRTFVRLLAWMTPLNVLTYILPTTLALAALGNWQEWKTDYIVTASRLIGGPWLGAAMLIAAMIGTASLSNSTILYTTRIPATMAEDGYLPAWLGKIHPRYRTPARAIAVSALVYCILAKYQVEDLVNIYIWTRIATTILTLFAAWRMRAKLPDAPRSFRIPGGSFGLAYVLIFPVILCALKIAQSEDYVWKYAPWLLASGPGSVFDFARRLQDEARRRIKLFGNILTLRASRCHPERRLARLAFPSRSEGASRSRGISPAFGGNGHGIPCPYGYSRCYRVAPSFSAIVFACRNSSR